MLTNFDSALAVLRKMHQVQNENAATHFRVPNEDDRATSSEEGFLRFFSNNSSIALRLHLDL